MDVHDSGTRSYNMSRIHGKDTKPEEIVRKYLFALGFRYRKNDKRYPGKPDIVIPKYRAMIFVNGCFWHKHLGCHYFKWPQTNAAFWREKIESNARRDQRNYEHLIHDGWRVFVIWECELKPLVQQRFLTELAEKIVNQ